MNETIKNILTRRSVKKYKEEMPPMELIDEILKAGTYAPSGMNKQSPIIIAITNKEVRDKLASLNARIMGSQADPFYGAPVVLVVLADKKYPTYIYDGSVVIENMLIAAHSLGLGACWIHRAKEEFATAEGQEILKMLGINGEYEGIGHCIVGYALQDTIEDKPRKENYIYKI